MRFILVIREFIRLDIIVKNIGGMNKRFRDVMLRDLGMLCWGVGWGGGEVGVILKRNKF